MVGFSCIRGISLAWNSCFDFESGGLPPFGFYIFFTTTNVNVTV